MPTPERILIIRPSALGDVCRTVPVLVSLRRAFPGAEIDWVVQDDYAAAVAAHPALTKVVRFPRRRFVGWWRRPAVTRRILQWLHDLRRHRYDLVIDVQGLGRSGAIAWATRAPRRVGSRAARELGWLGYSVRHPRPSAAHVVDQMLELLEAEGIGPVPDLRLYVPSEDAGWWAGRREGGRYAVLAPTSRWPSKRWPIDRWSDLVGPLRERGLDRVVLVGAPGEEPQVAELTERHNGAVVDLTGRTSIGQVMAVIAEADLVLANDSAPLHMAVGLDRPCIGLFGPTDPAFVGPYRRDDAVVRPGAVARRFRRRGLGDELMRRIATAEVLAAIDRLRAAALEPGPAPASRVCVQPTAT